ncbi:MAG: glycosyltransferase [Elusimicrobia bacterium]|nr:glycosyltransferase [Elusimicrobiota bacterium]
MRIVHFGTFSVGEGYPRNAVVAGGLRRAGVSVVECRRELWRGLEDKVRCATALPAGLGLLPRLACAWAGLAWEYLFRCPPHDVVLVGYSGHLDVFLARALAFLKGKPVVLDAFLSLHEAVVEDRGAARPASLRAFALRLLDRASSMAADLVLLDTDEHVRYYREVLGASGARFARVFVGGEETFSPRPKTRETGRTEVLFFGSFLPLHGADVIVDAVRMLAGDKTFHCTLIGDGMEWERCHGLAAGIAEDALTWERRWVGHDELARRIADSDICLGIFGAGGKAARVIPCKAFQALAMGKPLITADTPAAREALVHGQNAYLVAPGDPRALADAVLHVKGSRALSERLSAEGLRTYRERFCMDAIGKGLKGELEGRFGPFADA